MIVFETGSGKFVQMSFDSGFTSNHELSTRFVNELHARRILSLDKRYNYLLDKTMLFLEE